MCYRKQMKIFFFDEKHTFELAKNFTEYLLIGAYLTLMSTTNFTHTNTQPGYPGTHL